METSLLKAFVECRRALSSVPATRKTTKQENKRENLRANKDIDKKLPYL